MATSRVGRRLQQSRLRQRPLMLQLQQPRLQLQPLTLQLQQPR